LDLNSSNRGCARLGGEVDPPLGVVVEEVAVLVVLVRVVLDLAVGRLRRGCVEKYSGLVAIRE